MDRAGDGHGHIVINVENGNNSGQGGGRLPRGPRAVIQ
jgi:hypothetical protein